MKPITYWLQTSEIDQLVNDYGATFEKLSPATRRDIIACLANDSYYCAGYSEDLDDVFPRVESLTRHDKDLLIEAIAATLTHHGNPWVENARANVAIASSSTL